MDKINTQKITKIEKIALKYILKKAKKTIKKAQEKTTKTAKYKIKLIKNIIAITKEIEILTNNNEPITQEMLTLQTTNELEKILIQAIEYLEKNLGLK